MALFRASWAGAGALFRASLPIAARSCTPAEAPRHYCCVSPHLPSYSPPLFANTFFCAEKQEKLTDLGPRAPPVGGAPEESCVSAPPRVPIGILNITWQSPVASSSPRSSALQELLPPSAPPTTRVSPSLEGALPPTCEGEVLEPLLLRWKPRKSYKQRTMSLASTKSRRRWAARRR
ncbi:hypothetical protein cyc_02910 [Cyclospora cayetanensis]|uniref:Uncharacterized protein n=1 Tax=Cyclospora cayetanensis TaxID=88456 RepID=A0A1D3CYG4_9EIME|nr:hypothetical protein cyc_02910 [Cyclospora cayetanensis]